MKDNNINLLPSTHHFMFCAYLANDRREGLVDVKQLALHIANRQADWQSFKQHVIETALSR